jgi:membrane protein required for colicin V production
MTSIDYVIIAIVTISAVIGVARGFIRETLSLISWIAAFWLAFVFAEPLSASLTSYIDKPTLRVIAAFTGIFVIALLLLTLMSYFLHKLLVGRGVQGTDRILGGLFGAVRGVVIVAAILILLKVIPLVDQKAMSQSLLVKQLQPLVVMLTDVLPTDMRRMVTQAGKSGKKTSTAGKSGPPVAVGR